MSYQCLAGCFDDGADDRGEYGLYSWRLDGAERERGVCAYLPGPDVGCVRAREPTRSHLRAWTRGKCFLQEVNFGSRCGQRSRKQSHRVGITPEGSLGMKMAGLGGRSCPEGWRRSPREKDTVKTLARSASSYHNTSTQDIVPALPSFPHSHGPNPGRVRNLSTQARPQFPSLQLAQRSLNFKW